MGYLPASLPLAVSPAWESAPCGRVSSEGDPGGRIASLPAGRGFLPARSRKLPRLPPWPSGTDGPRASLLRGTLSWQGKNRTPDRIVLLRRPVSQRRAVSVVDGFDRSPAIRLTAPPPGDRPSSARRQRPAERRSRGKYRTSGRLRRRRGRRKSCRPWR